ncbi:MAG: hypothetical protein U9N45_01270 [Gemmatimonadota bacterium]|nr:hypothetical protein [Gemmatimonadota bacterium]
MNKKQTTGALPTVPFGPHQVTRLILGGNPFVWNSHFTDELNREMEEYYTPEMIVETLHRCQAAGIDTIQARGDYHRMFHYLEIFRREGGDLKFIAQTASEMYDVHHNIRMIHTFGAIAIYHHGSRSDELWREGKIDEVQDYLKSIRDTGLLVGMAAHIPEVFDYVEDKGWDLDFYMVPFYNIARKPRESAVVTGVFQFEEFDPDDPPRMCRFIKATDKQCLAYKVLGAGRKCGTQEDTRRAFEWAFANIKPEDCVVVGMFPKHRDEPALDVRYTIEAIRA